MTENTNDDTHVADPHSRWVFDEGVTNAFPAMLRSSIPGLSDMRAFTTRLASDHLARALPGTSRILDIGASRGDAVAPIMQLHPSEHYVMCEHSMPMMDTLRSRFGCAPNVDLVNADLSENLQWLARSPPFHLVLSVLTLMFIPLENRQELLYRLRCGMAPGAAIIVVEKTLGDTPATQSLLVDSYHSFKCDNGYHPDAVERKRLSLKGSLVPVKAAWTEDMMRDAGLIDIQQVWRCLQFVGWIAFAPK